MAGILTVQTIQGPTSGANANKVIIPAGQTLDASAGGLVTPAGHVVQVQDAYGSTQVTIANSGSGRIYSDLLTISYTPVSSSNKIVLLGTSGFAANVSESSAGAFGIVFNVNGTTHDFSNYPWFDPVTTSYPGYPPDTTISKTVAVPTGSSFDIKLQGYSYNESSGTMSPRFLQYSLTVMEIAQ
jgi:hypothetical protein